jgi:glucosylceramidase
MIASDQADFIKNYLGPAFVNTNIQTKIIIYDHNWDRPEYPLEVLNDVDARNYIDGTAWHCYGGDYENQSTVYNSYPGKNIYFTECSGGGWDTNFASVLTWNFENLFIGSTRHWARTVLLWNLALDEDDGPHIGGCNNCRGVITVGMNDYILNPEYYIIGHLSKFVMPGAHRISSDHISEDLDSVAFINPDGSIILIVLNKSNSSQEIAVNWKGQHFVYENLPQRSVVTLKW